MTESYQVVVFNDDDHSHHYVVELLGRVVGHSPEYAMRLTRSIDSDGRATVYYGPRADAEAVLAEINAAGPDSLLARSTGPLAATIEPWDGTPMPPIGQPRQREWPRYVAVYLTFLAAVSCWIGYLTEFDPDESETLFATAILTGIVTVGIVSAFIPRTRRVLWLVLLATFAGLMFGRVRAIVSGGLTKPRLVATTTLLWLQAAAAAGFGFDRPRMRDEGADQ